MDEKASHLLQVLQDVNRDELITKLNQIKENNDNHISHLFLEDYFRSKDAHVSPEVYHHEAQCIVNIFPQYSVEYIQSMLGTLGSESNRVIIILRQLLKNEPINYTHKALTNEQNQIKNQIIPECLDLFSQVTGFNDELDKLDMEHNFLKRKSTTEVSMGAPKIKIKPAVSMCNTTSTMKNTFMPDTCTSFSTINNSHLFDTSGCIPFSNEPYPPVGQRNRPIISFPDEVPPPAELRSTVTSTISSCSSNLDSTTVPLDGKINVIASHGTSNSSSIAIPPKQTSTNFERYKVPSVYSDPSTTMDEILPKPSEITAPLDLRDYNDILDMLEISSEAETESDSYCSVDEQEEADDGDECHTKPSLSYDNKLVSKIMEMFPDASPAYIKQLCMGKSVSASDIDFVLQIMLSNPNYPKREEKEPSPDPDLDLEEQVALLSEILPDADPNYLQYNAELYLHDKEKLKEFMSNALELKNYPTRKEYLRKQQLSAQVKQYTTEFNVEKFLELIPDPDTYFNDPNKKSSLIQSSRIDVFSLHYARSFLRNQYPILPIKMINSIMVKNKDCLIPTVKELDAIVATKKGLMKTKRKCLSIDNSTLQNIPLLQEIAYLSHRDEIKSYIQEKEAKEKMEKELAKQNGLLRTCNCCFSDEVMPKNIVNCENGCDFCNECVKTSVEILFGEGKLEFPCLQDCGTVFSLQTLKDVLSPKMFSKMAQKKQLEEVKAAGIEELEMCPFCDFATIPAPGDKLFRCLNPECMKESCRQCKEPSHVPLRCDEIEKDDDVKRRTYIENKMTEALIRVCYKCGMKFIKADGCNKMTCSCGAMMCYVCGEPVRDYKHFNGQGGDQYHLCPLYSDTNELHKTAVIKGAEQAKAEIGVTSDPTKLKIDPTADLHHHYKNKSHKSQHGHPIAVHGLGHMNVLLPGMHPTLLTRGRRHHHHGRCPRHRHRQE